MHRHVLSERGVGSGGRSRLVGAGRQNGDTAEHDECHSKLDAQGDPLGREGRAGEWGQLHARLTPPLVLGAEPAGHRGDLRRLTLDDRVCELAYIGVLAIGLDRVGHVDRSLVMLDHHREEHFVEG